MIRAWMCLVALVAAAGVGATGVGCSSTPSTFFSREEMLQPTNCAPCHQSHFDDWAQSMHAQASDDPVFIAMNQRGQRETGGGLGTFCVKCHAPMAVQDGKTKDGLNLASLPQYYKGVTCFFCHSIDSVGSSHNNASVSLAGDLVMRGELQDPPPVANPKHASTYSTFHDDQQKDSATMCGSCHDIDSPAGGKIERTFIEWSASAFSGPHGSTCSFSGCHMSASTSTAVVGTGGPKRHYHAHNFPAVDVSLQTSRSAPADAGAFPPAATDRGLPETVAVQNALNSNAIAGALCVNVNNGIRVILDTVGIGHHWPSGAAQDRRLWAEVIAYRADGSVAYSSGVVPNGASVTSVAAKDPDFWLLRDCMFNAQNQPVANFWEAAKVGGFDLPALTTFLRTDPAFYLNHVVQSFPRNAAGIGERPARVTLRIRIQPIGLDVLNDLVASNDLEPSIVAKMPTFDVSLVGPGGDGFPPPGGLEWTPQSMESTPDPGTTFTIYTDDEGPATCVSSISFVPGQPVRAGSAATCPPPSD